ncbi:MAG: serine hydrolase [bacterium]|nr:serine hydrolase [bacterium]
MKENLGLSRKVKDIAESFCSKPNEISIAVVNLKTSEPEISGYNMENFMYPASIYKIFIAAEILRQIDSGQRNLDDLVKIESINVNDKENPKFFPKTTRVDHRPLLKDGDLVTVDYLLDLMLTRSDNTASNVLLDVADRESINNHIILPNNWNGSEVTRKFLDRLKEQKEYRVSKITVSNTRHLVEFFCRVDSNQMVNQWVSGKLKEYMLKLNNSNKKGLYIPEFLEYYCKGGWLEVNGYKWNVWRGIKSVYQKGYAIIRYSGDTGVVTGKNSHYAIAVLTITKTKWPWVKFPMEKLSKQIHDLMESRQ